MPPFEIVTADILEWLAAYNGEPFHALLCDPPYHLTSIAKRFGKPDAAPAQHGKDGAFARASAGFMGQTWDGGDIAFRPETWAAFLPVLHPGAFGMAFAGSRGWHRLAVAIEDAGFIIHPSIFGWVYASGFPKATRIDTQIDRAAGAERETVQRTDGRYAYGFSESAKKAMGMSDAAQASQGFVGDPSIQSLPATDLAKTWEHHRYGGQAVKPALEPVIVFQKPYEGRPVDDITRTGAGALNVDGARIGVGERTQSAAGSVGFGPERDDGYEYGLGRKYNTGGRWPANFAVVHMAACVKVGIELCKSPGMKASDPPKSFDKPGSGGDITIQIGSHVMRMPGYADENGMELVERWACVPECPVRRLNDQAGRLSSGQGKVVRKRSDTGYSGGWPGGDGEVYGDTGYASRFFFTAVEAALTEADVVQYEEKADVEERERGLRFVLPCAMAGKPGIIHKADPLETETHFVLRKKAKSGVERLNRRNEESGYRPDSYGHGDEEWIEVTCRRNSHPTVKPIDLVRWLATLLLPPDAYAPRRLLVPFAGVGSEVIGARQAGWEEIVGVELHERYAAIGRQRLAAHLGMF